jgi:hypothetical protein
VAILFSLLLHAVLSALFALSFYLIGHFSWSLETLIKKNRAGLRPGPAPDRRRDPSRPGEFSTSRRGRPEPSPAGRLLAGSGRLFLVYTAFALLIAVAVFRRRDFVLNHGQADTPRPESFSSPWPPPRSENRPRRGGAEAIPGAGIVYLPSGPAVKAATFGFSALAADVAYVRAIQYYGNHEHPRRARHFKPHLHNHRRPRPALDRSLLTAALIAHYDFQDRELALKAYDDGRGPQSRGLDLPVRGGHYCQMYLKDIERAKAYFRKSMDIPAPPKSPSAFSPTPPSKRWITGPPGNVEGSLRNGGRPEIRKIASNHLYNVKASVDAAALKSVLARFREERGRAARNLEELVSAGLIAYVPKDFDRKDYLYDPETGEIKTAVNPWKR